MNVCAWKNVGHICTSYQPTANIFFQIKEKFSPPEITFFHHLGTKGKNSRKPLPQHLIFLPLAHLSQVPCFPKDVRVLVDGHATPLTNCPISSSTVMTFAAILPQQPTGVVLVILLNGQVSNIYLKHLYSSLCSSLLRQIAFSKMAADRCPTRHALLQRDIGPAPIQSLR